MSRSLNMTLDTRGHNLPCRSWPPRLPLVARCSVVAKGVEETATPTGTDREEQRHSKSSEEQRFGRALDQSGTSDAVASR